MESAASGRWSSVPRTAELLASVPALALAVCAAWLASQAPELYQRSVQEDGLLEWVTFWSFLGAAAMHLMAMREARRSQASLPWFVFGLGVFCLLVALEEISWGQRLLGYRPPAYFLAENVQQELNLHNTIGDDLRQLGFLGVCWAYGVALPFVARISPRARGWLDRLGILAPPLALCPAFAATASLYQAYPWSHTGEWAEAMLGTTMILGAVLQWHAIRRLNDVESSRGPGRALLLAWLATTLLGVSSVQLGRLAVVDPADRIEAARRELEALRSDVAGARTRTRCGIHKRVYTMVMTYEQNHLFEGEFAALVSQGESRERARFFLDPWNSPYWVQHVCSADRRRRAIFVYSFGPDRRRDSSDWAILGDDLGAWISRPRGSAED